MTSGWRAAARRMARDEERRGRYSTFGQSAWCENEAGLPEVRHGLRRNLTEGLRGRRRSEVETWTYSGAAALEQLDKLQAQTEDPVLLDGYDRARVRLVDLGGFLVVAACDGVA